MQLVNECHVVVLSSRVTTHMEYLEKSGNLMLVGEMSGKLGKVREIVVACGVPPQLRYRWSQNKHNLSTGM